MSPSTTEHAWAAGRALGPDDLARLSLGRCRHPAEWQALATIATIIALLEIVLYIIGPQGRDAIESSLKWAPRGVLGPLMTLIHPGGVVGTVFGVVLVTTVFDLVQHWLKRVEVHSQGIEITAETFPDVHPDVEALRLRFELGRVRVFVLKSTQTSYSLGLFQPHIVVLPFGWLGLLTRDELRFALGHEFGHVKLGHTFLSPFLGGSDWSGQGVTALLQQARSLILSSFQQAQELSCDRVGVVACGGTGPAFTALVKIGLGNPRNARLDPSTLAAQAAEVYQGSMGVASRLWSIRRSQPSLFYRLGELVRWAGLPPEAPPQCDHVDTPGAGVPAVISTPSAAPGGAG